MTATRTLDMSEGKCKSESEDETESVKSDKSSSKKKRIRKQRRKGEQQPVLPSTSLKDSRTNENAPPSDHAVEEQAILTINTNSKGITPSNSAKVRSPNSREARKLCPYTKKLKPRVQAYETQSQLVMVKEETVSPSGYQDLYHPTTLNLHDQVNQSMAVLVSGSSHNGPTNAVVSYVSIAQRILISRDSL